MKTTMSGSIGAIPLTPGSTIGFDTTSGREDRAAERMATANPIAVEVFRVRSLEKTERVFVNCNIAILIHHFHNWKQLFKDLR
jgi:hypothetical protein